jgi:folate-dependent phosphoribosylglycinamide formyltransferase PurN
MISRSCSATAEIVERCVDEGTSSSLSRILSNQYVAEGGEQSMAETATIAYHRERAEQERRRANQATDGRSKTVHTELALAHGRAAILGGHRLRAVHDR